MAVLEVIATSIDLLGFELEIKTGDPGKGNDIESEKGVGCESADMDLCREGGEEKRGERFMEID